MNLKQALALLDIKVLDHFIVAGTFEGIFIASTNLMTSLDSAALRRFDLKIRFDYLKPKQAWTLFVDTRTQLGIDAPPSVAE